jgi:hypothetical protein
MAEALDQLAAAFHKLARERDRLREQLNRIAESAEGGRLGPGVWALQSAWGCVDLLADHAEWLAAHARRRTVVLRIV